jgi:hypothetical protein
MRTLGGEVARGRWSRSATGRGLSESLAVHDVTVLRCCTAPDLPDEPGGPGFRCSGIPAEDCHRGFRLLSKPRSTLKDRGASTCMRLRIRLSRCRWGLQGI